LKPVRIANLSGRSVSTDGSVRVLDSGGSPDGRTVSLSSNRPLIVILSTVALDAVGIGLALPVIPSLLRELSHESRIAGHYGYFMAIYPLMQFLFSPVLGRLSDRFGRRPVLLVSMAGAVVDYSVMGLSPLLSVLYLGRMVAGITGASVAVATAYIADISGEDDRARRFGYMNAAFGLGFVAGPLMGGLFGSLSPRYPFFLAALFNALNLILGYFTLPESHLRGDPPADRGPRDRIGSFGAILANRAIWPSLAAYFLIFLISQIPNSIWVVYGEDKFGWDVWMVGLTYAGFGLLHAVAQAFLTEPTTRRFGERGAIFLGVMVDSSAFVAMALVTRGWMVFPILILFTAGGIAITALQSMLSKQVDEARQGELQGTLVSLTSLAEIIGPIAATTIYAALPSWARGAVWLVGVGLYAVCFPFLLSRMEGTTAERGS
jgi:DHA1 family tetracycline resistance protein-like MFS transporter